MDVLHAKAHEGSGEAWLRIDDAVSTMRHEEVFWRCDNKRSPGPSQWSVSYSRCETLGLAITDVRRYAYYGAVIRYVEIMLCNHITNATVTLDRRDPGLPLLLLMPIIIVPTDVTVSHPTGEYSHERNIKITSGE